MKSIIVLIALHMLLGKDFMWLMHVALRDALAASQFFCEKKTISIVQFCLFEWRKCQKMPSLTEELNYSVLNAQFGEIPSSAEVRVLSADFRAVFLKFT